VTHLGDLACALVDGELGAEARDEARAHVASCAPCQIEVAQQRHVKRRLHAVARADAVDPCNSLLAKLRAIPDAAQRGCDLPLDEAAPGALTLGLEGVRRSGRRLSGRRAPSWPGRSRPARRTAPSAAVRPNLARRAGPRTVAAAGLAASVMVGLGGGVTGSSASGSGAPTQLPQTSASPSTAQSVSLDIPAPRPYVRTAVSVVYRRP
jgi:hypothetical protein